MIETKELILIQRVLIQRVEVEGLPATEMVVPWASLEDLPDVLKSLFPKKAEIRIIIVDQG
jgi:hypothetical protein